jgi:serine protease inhibitor ecotin
MPRRLTTEEFFEKAKAVHGDRYDYSLAVYEGSKTKVTICCPDHGPFAQAPGNHLHGYGCPGCGGNKRHTSGTFIEKAEAVHRDRYDYSQVRYTNAYTKVTIICPDHGPFAQVPGNHLHGSGCPGCGGRKQLTTETFIEKAKAIHGDRYDYSAVEYANNKTPVRIICRDHGIFEQAPNKHLSQRGCRSCGRIATSLKQALTSDEFVEKARVIHGDCYDYSQVEYVNSNTNVMIVCPEHGPFVQSPSNHLSGKGCLDCAGKRQLTTETFIEKATAIHGDRYDYSQVEYVNFSTNVMIVCPDHGPFVQSPSNHLSGKGCADCAGKNVTTEKFIEKAREIHGDRYDYSQVEYVSNSTKVTIICPEHGPFDQLPSNHTHIKLKVGCPDCAEFGFNPSEPGLLYYLAITTDDGDTRYKIGITNHTVQARFPARDMARIRIVWTRRYSIGRAAAEREAEILRKYAGDRYTGPDILIGAGNTELFTHDVLGLDK